MSSVHWIENNSVLQAWAFLALNGVTWLGLLFTKKMKYSE